MAKCKRAQKQPKTNLIKQDPPTRRSVMNIISAGVGFAVGAQISCNRERPVQVNKSLSSASARTINVKPSNHSQSVSNSAVQLDLNLDDFIIHGNSPLTYEAKRHTIGTSVITHEKHLYIRNNLPMPNREIVSKPDEWNLHITGVKNSREINVAELKTLGLHTVTAVLQCSGNGRAFYTHGPSGSQWSTGAAGCVIWSGVKLSDVINHLGGVIGKANYLTSTGADPLPKGVDPVAVIVERSIPLEKAMKDAILAWEMNGEAISLEHGGPLRLVVPGYFGCNQIKYVKRLAFTKEQTQAKIQKAGYRFRPIGEKGSPKYPSMWAMPIKSWLTNEEQLFGNRQVLRGVAMGGERSVSKVELSLDGGKSWKLAPFIGPDLGPFAWRLFQLNVHLPYGKHKLISRAYDDQGNQQTETRKENERGYGHSGWRDHALNVEVHPLNMRDKPQGKLTKSKEQASLQEAKNLKKEPQLELSAKAQRGKEVYLKETMPQCGVCHSLEDAGTQGAVGPKLDELKPTIAQIKKAVSKGLGAMPAQKQLSEEQLDALAQYVFEASK